MKIINVTVREKIAERNTDIEYVCGNSDYVVDFDFDEEWGGFEIKTARFVYGKSHTDVVFTGTQCAVPPLFDIYGFSVGVFAGDLHTTSPAFVRAKRSILCGGGLPAEPPDDVYAQITALCNEAVSEAKNVREDADAGKFDGAPGKTPVAGTDYFTEADKQAIAAEAAQGVGFPKPTREDNGTYLGCKNGAAAWMPVEASGGGGAEQWELLNTIEISEVVNRIRISTDKGGNPFSLKRAIVVCELNRDMGDPFTFIKMKPNGFTVCNNQQINTTKEKVYCCYIFEHVPGFGILADTVLKDQNYNWIFTVEKMGYKFNDDYKTESINYIEIEANDGKKNVCASGKIDVFGVRA